MTTSPSEGDRSPLSGVFTPDNLFRGKVAPANPYDLQTFSTLGGMEYKDLCWMLAHVLKMMGGSISLTLEELKDMAANTPPVILLEEVRGPLGFDKVVVLRIKDGQGDQ